MQLGLLKKKLGPLGNAKPLLPREMMVTSISEATTSPLQFLVPANYRRYEAGRNDPKTPALTQLSMEPTPN